VAGVANSFPKKLLPLIQGSGPVRRSTHDPSREPRSLQARQRVLHSASCQNRLERYTRTSAGQARALHNKIPVKLQDARRYPKRNR
jgi:hypothetical protein